MSMSYEVDVHLFFLNFLSFLKTVENLVYNVQTNSQIHQKP